MSTEQPFDEIAQNLRFLDDWEDRYRYLIELGEELEPIGPDERNDKNKVSGCVSQVWLVSESKKQNEQTIINYRGDSDAMIVKGLVAILIALYSGQTAQKIARTDAIKLFDELGLREHLTSQRANGLVAMVKRIRGEAQALL